MHVRRKRLAVLAFVSARRASDLQTLLAINREPIAWTFHGDSRDDSRRGDRFHNPKGGRMLTGAEQIVVERQRQIREEGWTAEHDDEHHAGGDSVSRSIGFASASRRRCC